MSSASITLAEIEHLAHLTRLNLTDEQKQSLLGDMQSILGLISELEEVNVSGVTTDGYNHIQHTMQTRTGVDPCKEADHMMKNVQHALENNGIVVKSSMS